MTTIVPTSEEDPVLSIVRFTAEMSWADASVEVAEPQVTRLCLEAEECVVAGRWLDLASLMLTSADVIFSKASIKGEGRREYMPLEKEVVELKEKYHDVLLKEKYHDVLAIFANMDHNFLLPRISTFRLNDVRRLGNISYVMRTIKPNRLTEDVAETMLVR